MTTSVTIEAHVPADKEVLVTIHGDGNLLELFRLQDGQIAERYVYDLRSIEVREVPKEPTS